MAYTKVQRCLFYCLVAASSPWKMHAFQVYNPIRTLSVRIQATDPREAEEIARMDLLEKASKLRQEAQDLESKLQRDRPRSEAPVVEKPPAYTSVDDSVWELSYRFSDEAESRVEEGAKRDFYGGKLVVKLRSDGYTDFVSHQPSAGTANKKVDIVKAWGWDVERSDEDEQDYLLFSVDVTTPNGEKLRVYLQARLEKESDESLSLKDGTITIKQDVVRPQGWALLSPKGILAQFVNVGNFATKPTK